MGAVEIGTGATLTFASGFFAQVTDIRWDEVDRQNFDVTDWHTDPAPDGRFGDKQFDLADLVDPGSLVIEMHFNPITDLPLDDAETLELLFPASSGAAARYLASAFLTEVEFQAPLENVMVATATVKLSGEVTIQSVDYFYLLTDDGDPAYNDDGDRILIVS